MTSAVTETQLSLPCGCVVAVWPHGKGDNPGTTAEIASTCKAHGQEFRATLLRWRKDARSAVTLYRNRGASEMAARCQVAGYAYERVLRELGWEPEGSAK